MTGEGCVERFIPHYASTDQAPACTATRGRPLDEANARFLFGGKRNEVDAKDWHVSDYEVVVCLRQPLVVRANDVVNCHCLA